MNKNAHDVSLMVFKDMRLWIGYDVEVLGKYEKIMCSVPVDGLEIREIGESIGILCRQGRKRHFIWLNAGLGAEYIFQMANTHIMYGTPIDLLDTED